LKFYFEWDPQKANSNKVKHNVTFERAATVFTDSRAVSIYDNEHSGDEDRWMTLGLASTGVLMVVNHTYKKVDESTATIRIISSRKATKNEEKQYME
jgi:hypothetical protein